MAKKTNIVKDITGIKAAKLLPNNLADLCKLSIEQMRERGVSELNAKKIRAAIDLAREIADPGTEYRTRITGPAAAMAYCQKEFCALANHGVQEEFWIVTLDTKNQPIAKHQITVGTLRNSLVHPREVFRPAISDAANCFIAVHNHPSGDTTPSDQDISVTERLEAAAHIVVGRNGSTSIQEWRQHSFR